MTDVVKMKCELFWAQLTKINEMSGKYQVNLGMLSDAAVKALEDMGVSVSEKEGMGKCIVCKSNTPIKAFDADGNEIEELVGNGTKAKVMVSAYEWTYKNKKGVSPSLKKLVVTDLVKYETGGKLDDEDVL
jgi:hypothetical protein